MKYVYNDIAELKSIIARLHDGESKTFSIYDKSGKRVKYDFYKNMATKVLIDDGVEQDNPYYKEPVVEPVIEPDLTVEEANMATPIEEVDDIPEDTKAEVVDGVELVSSTTESSDEIAPDTSEETTDDNQEALVDEPEVIPSEYSVTTDQIDESIQKLLDDISDRDSKLVELTAEVGTLSEKVANYESELADKDHRIESLTLEVDSLSNEVDTLKDSLEDVNQLVNHLVSLGFKVTISK